MLKSKLYYAGLPLLVLIMLPSILCLIYLQKEHLVKEEMEERLEKKLLTTITVSKNDIHWIKEGKELVVFGEMFDVKGMVCKEDSIILTGLYDYAEKLLKDKIGLLLGNQKKGESPLQHLWVSFFMPFIPLDQSLESVIYLSLTAPPKYCSYTSTLVTADIALHTPPPDLMC